MQQQQRIAMVNILLAIYGYELTALIDTSSDLSLIREDALQKIRNPLIVKDNSRFWGVGIKENRTLGSCSASVSIDHDVFIARLCVVSNSLFNYQVLICKDILRDVIKSEQKRLNPRNLLLMCNLTTKMT
jgi:hypothetical protein